MWGGGSGERTYGSLVKKVDSSDWKDSREWGERTYGSLVKVDSSGWAGKMEWCVTYLLIVAFLCYDNSRNVAPYVWLGTSQRNGWE